MGSFFTDAQKAALQSVMTDMHDTFARTLKAYKEGRQVVISHNPTYSHIYNRPVGADTTIVTLEQTISARVFYYPRHLDKEVLASSTDDAIKLAQAAAEVRIKIPTADYEFMKGVERIVLDGVPFSVVSTASPHGLFGSGFYTFNLRRTS